MVKSGTTFTKRRTHSQCDICGIEIFSASFELSIAHSHGVMMCFDVNRKGTFEALTEYLDIVRGQCGTDIPILLVGCQNDIEGAREVRQEEIEQFQTDHDLPLYVGTSAKTGKNVRDAFNALFYMATKNEGFKDRIADEELKEQIGSPEIRERIERMKLKEHAAGVPPCRTM